MRTERIPALFSFVLFAAAMAAEAQLSQFPSQGRTGEAIKLSGQFESACFTGEMRFTILTGEINLYFIERCSSPPGQAIVYSFDRYLPPLAAGTYTVKLVRETISAEDITLMQVGPSRTLNVSQGHFRLTIDPPHPTEGQEVFLDVASVCIHDGFELVPGSGRSRRVLWHPTPILPPPCDPAPIHITRFSLGQPALGEHVVFLGPANVDGGPLLEALSFQVVHADTPALELQADRFRITANWATAAGASGAAHAVPLTNDSGAFWFFRPDNLEILIKVLNGCAVNGHFWVLGAGLTNVGVGIEIEDTATGAIWTYDNELGVPFAPVQDTGAFDCS